MKKLNLLLLKAFIGPFIATLFITNFLLLMIWFWKWLEDIVGKGLEISLILELVGYASLNQIPMSLPLAMLLSSIMTFGKLGETVELTALKALGVSMFRVMQPLIIVTVVFTLTAFYINDSVLPKTNTKLKNLLQDITSKKPELSIPEGVFYKGLEGYTIRVGKKNEDKSLKDILIFDNKSNADRFILADSGKILLSNDGNALILHLFNGNAYEYQKEDFENDKERTFPLVRNKFDENELIFDLSSFNFVRSENDYEYDARLKNNESISFFIDSLSKNVAERKIRLLDELHTNFFIRPSEDFNIDTLTFTPQNILEKLDTINNTVKSSINVHAADIAHNAKQYIYGAKIEIQNDQYLIDRHIIEWHKKYTLSIACLILFFVGAPFGAIFKKGGLGMPVVISTVVFIVYHVLTIAGEKLAKSDWTIVNGIWLATYVLAPIGLFLSYKAMTDSPIFDFKKIKRLFTKSKNK